MTAQSGAGGAAAVVGSDICLSWKCTLTANRPVPIGKIYVLVDLLNMNCMIEYHRYIL